MNKTPNDMLTAIVQRGVDGDWVPPIPEIYRNNIIRWDVYSVNKSGYVCYKYLYKYTNAGSKWLLDGMSFPDLIADKGFMGSVYGEECHVYNKKCIDGYCSAYPDNENCPHRSYLYHGILAYKLLLTKGADEAIEYLFENMPEEGEDE